MWWKYPTVKYSEYIRQQRVAFLGSPCVSRVENWQEPREDLTYGWSAAQVSSKFGYFEMDG